MGGPWHFMAYFAKTQWVGLAKRGPFVTGRWLTEPGHVWFAFGATEAEALAAVQRSVLH